MDIHIHNLQEQNKVTIDQLDGELSELNSQLMMKEEELASLREDNKLLIKHFRERKDKQMREVLTVPQVCEFQLMLV